jgi:hypothetical protein
MDFYVNLMTDSSVIEKIKLFATVGATPEFVQGAEGGDDEAVFSETLTIHY